MYCNADRCPAQAGGGDVLHGLLDGSRVVSVGKCDHNEDEENVYHRPGHEVSIGWLINAQ